MTALILFLASFMEAEQVSPGDTECNILYALTSDEVLYRQIEQWEYDKLLAAYLEKRGYHPDLDGCERRYQRAQHLLIARDPRMYDYSRHYYLERAKQCN